MAHPSSRVAVQVVGNRTCCGVVDNAVVGVVRCGTGMEGCRGKRASRQGCEDRILQPDRVGRRQKIGESVDVCGCT